MKRNETIDDVLQQHAGWIIEEKGLVKTFVFDSFEKAMKSMQELVPVIVGLNHHPDWKNSYNKVNVCLFTHDEDAVTKKDIELLKIIEENWGKS